MGRGVGVGEGGGTTVAVGAGTDVGGTSVGEAIATTVGDATAVGAARPGVEVDPCGVAVGGFELPEQAEATIPRAMIIARNAKRTVNYPHWETTTIRKRQLANLLAVEEASGAARRRLTRFQPKQ